ncbi:hypothetical protein CQA76_05365 [Campylobacter aviculae]|uniref:Uncharacterized protein n=1 Tax=Campylobacter aviculae TaxID=2510190 RepID=A0A4V6DWE8_9BACT|nr:hypothetical protein CQA76_05365 [Campylobacter aviculae]
MANIKITISTLPSNWIDSVANTINDLTMPIFEKMFSGVHNALYSGMGASIFVTYCIIWLLRQAQNGYVSRLIFLRIKEKN